VATLVLTNFATVSILKDDANSRFELFSSIWPIELTSAVAVILVMSFLYKSLVDLVDELEAREANAQHQALHDQLTGLANRALLEDRLGQALNRYRRSGEQVALLMLDLDRFKQVNDTLGHNAGDKLVQEVGERLRSLLRETDTVARIGGDEFAIVQVSPKGEADVRRLCDGELGVEPALGIAELVGVHAIAASNAAHACTRGDDDPGAVDTRDQREMRAAGLSPRPVSNRGVPAADARRLDRDEHFVGARRRHRNVVERECRWRTESIDGRGLHGLGDDSRPVGCLHSSTSHM